MFNNSLDKKPFFNKNDGTVIRDLTQSVFDFNVNNFVPLTAFKVPKDFVMRPDLISQSAYNNTSSTEFILKYNGISNPLTIDENDIILIPNLDAVKQTIKKQGTLSEDDKANNIRKSYKYIDPTKVPKKDAAINDFDKRYNKTDTIKDGALPPNINEEGQIIHRNGRVYFGESIGESACLKNGMSSGDFLKTVIQTKTI